MVNKGLKGLFDERFTGVHINKKSEEYAKEQQHQISEINCIIPKEKKYKILIIEPHADDSALSLGGSLVKFAEDGIEIISCCLFNKGGPDEINRRNENIHFWGNLLSSRLVFGDLYDYPYRREQGINDIYTYNKAKEFIRNLIRKEKPDFVLGPMGIGEHIDHVITNQAMRTLTNQETFDLFFYEDFPYANKDKYFFIRGIEKVNKAVEIKPLYNNITSQLENKALLNMVYPSQYQLTKTELIEMFSRYGKAICMEGIFMKKKLNKSDLYERFWYKKSNLKNNMILFQNSVF